jgi:XTP/dITP diphosphohydrolase
MPRVGPDAATSAYSKPEVRNLKEAQSNKTVTQLVLATRNAGKILEVERLLSAHAPQIKLRSVAEFNLDDVEETGDTFEANALLKAETIARQTGLPALADDSGIAIDALGGSPGVYSARWAGVHGDDEANLAKVLQELENTADADRGAQFVCVIALALPDGRSMTVRAEVEGQVRRIPVGNQGFGYDPIFQPVGFSITTAEMSPEEKDAISHRGKALREIAPKIAPFIGA